MRSLSRTVASPSEVSSAGSPARAVKDGSVRPGRPILRAALLATAGGLVAFLLIQGILAAYNVHVIRDAISRGLLADDYPSAFRLLSLRLTNLIDEGIGYLFFALVGMSIAARGHRLLFMLPAAGYVLAAAAVGVHQPEAIGTQWWIECYSTDFMCGGPWFAHPWFGPLVDLALVLVPGWVVAVRVRARRCPGVTDAPAVAAILAVVGVVALVGWTIAVIENGLDERALVAVAALGIGIGTARPWWPWLHVGFATFVSGSLAWLWETIIMPDPYFPFSDAWPYIVAGTWPMIAVGLLASGWQPLAWLLRRLQERPLRLVVAVNVLNVADAVMTAVAVRSGGALEANPLVRFVGLALKVIFVAVLTWLLFRRRPTALVWPASALLWVACYHISGILVNGWRTA